MSDGAIGLIGVALGGLLTGGVTWFHDWRRRIRDARAARRVIRSELSEAAKAVSDAKQGDHWPPGWTRSWSESWLTYRPILAATMDDDSFDTLAAAHLYIAQLEAGLAAGERGFAGHDLAFLEDVSTHLRAAEQVMS